MSIRAAIQLCLAAASCFLACSGEKHLDPPNEQSAHPLLGGTKADGDPPVVGVGAGCSGVLLHPRVVVYSAHCGTAIDSVTVGDVRFSAKRCEAAPSDGSVADDLAYCLLASPASADSVATPALGCELDSVTAGAILTVKGRGFPNMEELEAQVTVDGVADGLIVSADGVAACGGDSGGPVLIHLFTSTQSAQRLVGIVSRGSASCTVEERSIFVTPVGALVPWLEARTSLDLSACGTADGVWAPTPACRGEQGSFWAYCGTPVSVPGNDSSAPYVAIREISTTESAGTFDVIVKAEVSDLGWGVQEVDLSIEDGTGHSAWHDLRSFEPFQFTDIRLGPGTYRIEVSAVDFAGNRAASAKQVSLRNRERGAGECTTSLGARREPAFVWLVFAAVALASTRARRNARACRSRCPHPCLLRAMPRTSRR